MKSLILKTYVTSICLAAVVATMALPATGLRGHAASLLVLLAVAAIIGTRSIRVAALRIEFMAVDLFVLSALLVVAPVAGPLVALAGVLGGLIGPYRRPISIRTAFNLGALPLSAAAAAGAFAAVRGDVVTLSGETVLPVAAAAATFFFVNAVLTAVAVAVDRPTALGAEWMLAALGNGVGCVTSMMLAIGLSTCNHALGSPALLLGLVAAVPLVAYFRTQQARGEGATLRRPDSSNRPARQTVA